MNNPAEKPQPTHPGRRQFNRRILLGAVVAALGLGGYFAWQKFHGHADELEQYQLSTVQRGDIEDLVTATGTMQPREYVDVGAQVSGQLRKIHVEVGSVVQAGDLLAEIDPTVFRANVDARRAQVRNLRANLADREAQLALAQLQYARQKNLAAGDATTTESLQTADAAVRSAKAQVEAQRAQIEQNESTLRADEANLNYARIYAPMAGVVVSITARQGQTLNANQQAPTVLRIADLSTMMVQTQVSEADVGRLQPDMDVYFTTLGSRGRRWYGKLNKVEPTPTVTNNVVLYNALFDVANTQRNLLPQMTAQVFFVAATAKDTLIVPASAVNMRRAGSGKGGKPAAEEAPAAQKQDGTAPAGEGKAAAPAGRQHADGGRSGADASEREAGRKAGQDGRERPAGTGKAQDETARSPQAPATGGTQAPGQGGGAWQNMSREERRAAFERMTPEERQAFRERRQARAAAEGRSGEERPSASERPADAARDRGAESARSRPAGKPAGEGAGQASHTQVWAGVSAQRQRGPREGIVKVVTAEGKIEERKVQVGISNRVQVQILSGLAEGEQVVAGIKPPPGAQRAQGQRNALQNQGGMQGMPGAPGGAGGGGMGGRAR